MNNYPLEVAKAAQAFADALRAAAEGSVQPIGPEVPVPPGKPEPPDFNAAAFFDEIRESLFGGSLNQGQVDGHNILGKACTMAELDPLVQQSAYILATVYHETARTMQPIEEYGGWNTRYAPWFGRGYIQLTWEENYKKQQEKLKGMPLVHLHDIPYQVHDNKDLALNPHTSAIITVWGMKDGDFTGKKLDDYINNQSVDYVNARRIVNGTDRAEKIAEYAELYESAILVGMKL